jgi:uncharacterized spore protein YtfJ
MDNENTVKTTVEELRKLLAIQNFVGEAVETEDKLLIPVMKMGLAFGAGMGEGKGSGNNSGGTGKGSGAGAIAGVEPVSMVVVTKGLSGPEGIKVLSLTSGSQLSKAIEKAGTVITDVMQEGKSIMKERSEAKETPEAEETPEEE